MSTNLSVAPVAADVCVTGQLIPEALAEAARMGFRSVVNNRPDFEGGADQPTSAQIEAAARAAGIEYRFLPVVSGQQTPEDVTAFARLAAELPRPMLMFCRTGTRSTRLFQAAQALGS